MTKKKWFPMSGRVLTLLMYVLGIHYTVLQCIRVRIDECQYRNTLSRPMQTAQPQIYLLKSLSFANILPDERHSVNVSCPDISLSPVAVAIHTWTCFKYSTYAVQRGQSRRRNNAKDTLASRETKAKCDTVCPHVPTLRVRISQVVRNH